MERRTGRKRKQRDRKFYSNLLRGREIQRERGGGEGRGEGGERRRKRKREKKGGKM